MCESRDLCEVRCHTRKTGVVAKTATQTGIGISIHTTSTALYQMRFTRVSGTHEQDSPEPDIERILCLRGTSRNCWVRGVRVLGLGIRALPKKNIRGKKSAH